MRPKKIPDFVPLMVLSLPFLSIIKDAWKKETDTIPKNHRIYHFSDILQVRFDLYVRVLKILRSNVNKCN